MLKFFIICYIAVVTQLSATELPLEKESTSITINKIEWFDAKDNLDIDDLIEKKSNFKQLLIGFTPSPRILITCVSSIYLTYKLLTLPDENTASTLTYAMILAGVNLWGWH